MDKSDNFCLIVGKKYCRGHNVEIARKRVMLWTGSAMIRNFLPDPDPELEVRGPAPDPEQNLNLIENHK
jgi:hypothetical protein